MQARRPADGIGKRTIGKKAPVTNKGTHQQQDEAGLREHLQAATGMDPSYDLITADIVRQQLPHANLNTKKTEGPECTHQFAYILCHERLNIP